MQRKKKKCAIKGCDNITYSRLCFTHDKERKIEKSKKERAAKPPKSVKTKKPKKTVKVAKSEKAYKIKYPKTTILKKHTWDIMSLFIRLRDSDEAGYGKCCTCDNVCYFYNDCFQAGHFRSRQFLYLLFNEQNVNGQCGKCNGWGKGMTYEYGIFLDQKYGEGTASTLASQDKLPTAFRGGFYVEKILYFAEKAKEELHKKSLHKEITNKMKDKIHFYIRFANKFKSEEI